MTNLSGANLNNGAAVGPQGEGRDSPSTFPTYPAYKDSGVKWLGEVPEGWILARGDAYLRSQAKVVSADYLGGKEVFHYSIPVVQVTGDGQLEDGDEIDSSKLLVEQPQVLISKLNPRKNTVCLAGSREVVTVCSGEFVPLQSDCMDLKWVYYLVSSENFKKRLESLVESATRSHQRVNPSDILKFRGAFPLLAEQTQIARFLDHETARIDALIEEQQRLIELLKEKRQAVISHAVTKGLDPTVPMKDSGVEWLGEVPAHWGTNALNKLTVKITNGYVGPTRDILVESGVPYVQATHIKRGVVNFDDAYFVTPEWSMKMSKSILQEGDVLIVQTGAGTGDVGVVSSREAGYNCHALIILQAEKSILSGVFLGQVLQSHFGQSVLYSIRTGGMHPHLNCGEVKFVKIPVPPLSEQEEISNFVKALSEQAENLIIEAGSTIDLLQERRSALISAAVTGKIDVRGWQPPPSTQAPKLEVAEAN